MDIQDYIYLKKKLYDFVIDFLENDEETSDVDYQSFHKNILKYIFDLQEDENHTEMKSFLRLLNKIAKNHHLTSSFCEKIKSILYSFRNDIKQTLSNREIFDIFKDNKLLFRFLLKRKTIKIDQYIVKYIESKPSYELYFYPEIHKFLSSKKRSQIKSQLSEENSYSDKKFNEKRKIGENDSYICSLIRNDLIDEFVSYVNKRSISLSSQIRQSIFETNHFLEKNENTTLIEYSAFYGSIQIFNYLRFNNVEMAPRLWLYAIHSKNAEIIHLLEENRVESENEYIDCFSESIRCHHNDIAEYIQNNLMNDIDITNNDDIITSIYSSYNYKYFHTNFDFENLFYNVCKYKHNKIVDLFIEMKKDMIEKILLKKDWLKNSDNNVNKVAVLYYELMKCKTAQWEWLNLVYFVIPPSITIIGTCNFKEFSPLRYVSIPPSVTVIGERAFNGCRKLKRVKIGSSLTKIGNFAFCLCKSLEQINIPNSVTEIGSSAFYACRSLKQIKIPSSVTSIGDRAFGVCQSLKYIEIPSSVTSIGEGTFGGCSSLIHITIPSSVTSFGEKAFYDCSSLTQISIPLTETKIRQDVFGYCTSLTRITIPSSVTEIGELSFSGCSSLAQITFEIPSSVTSIGYEAFSGCSSLTQITIPSSLNSIGNYAFKECSSLVQISFESPSSLTSIGYCSFTRCTSLTKIVIPSSVTEIGEKAFDECSSLTQVIIPSFVKKIETNLFTECSSLAQVLFESPSSVIGIGYLAFYNCSSLTQIVIPSSVTLIYLSAFEGCSSLTKISFESPSSLNSISEQAFSDCISLKQIEIPSSVTLIQQKSFQNCSSLEKVVILSSEFVVEDFAFIGCSSLKRVILHSSVKSINKNAFPKDVKYDAKLK